MDDMLWGVTLRSPHPFARIIAVDIGRRSPPRACTPCSPPTTCPAATSTAWSSSDQPVLAHDVVRYQGEAIALVAADHPEIARQAAKKIRVDYQVWDPVTDARDALGHPNWNRLHDDPADSIELSRSAAPIHPKGNMVRHLKIRKGDPDAAADVVGLGARRWPVERLGATEVGRRAFPAAGAVQSMSLRAVSSGVSRLRASSSISAHAAVGIGASSAKQVIHAGHRPLIPHWPMSQRQIGFTPPLVGSICFSTSRTYSSGSLSTGVTPATCRASKAANATARSWRCCRLGEAAEVGQPLALLLGHVVAVGQVRRGDRGDTTRRCRPRGPPTAATASRISLWSSIASSVSASGSVPAAPLPTRSSSG